MTKHKKLTLISVCIIVVLVLLDQLLKIWVKTHLTLGQTVPVLGDWFNLYFIENPGMAFGLSFGQNIGKLLLSLFRIGLTGVMCVYMHRLIRKDRMNLFSLIVFCLIIAGALGNILDCLFYGIIFSESTPFAVASMCPQAGGYAPFFFGKVVDMFYVKLFPIPENFPLWGGSYFFPAIFNIADSCITVGVFLVLIFNKHFIALFDKEPNEEPIPSESEHQ